MFGTDYPYLSTQLRIKELDELPLPKGMVAGIKRDNALALFPRLKA